MDAKKKRHQCRDRCTTKHKHFPLNCPNDDRLVTSLEPSNQRCSLPLSAPTLVSSLTAHGGRHGQSDQQRRNNGNTKSDAQRSEEAAFNSFEEHQR